MSVRGVVTGERMLEVTSPQRNVNKYGDGRRTPSSHRHSTDMDSMLTNQSMSALTCVYRLRVSYADGCGIPDNSSRPARG